MAGRVPVAAVRLIFLNLVLGLSIPVACAHDFWIEPSSFSPAPGTRVQFLARVGDHFLGEVFPRDRGHLKRFVLSGPTGAHHIQGSWGDRSLGSIRIDESGVYSVAYLSNPSISRLALPKFREYLAEEDVAGLALHLGSEKGEVVESFTRLAKTLLRSGSAPGKDRFTGLPLEIVLLNPVENLQVGEVLEFQLLENHAPTSDLILKAYRRQPQTSPNKSLSASVTSLERVAGVEGHYRLKPDGDGIWLVRAVRIVPPGPGESGGQWQSFWASLTFEVKSGPPS